MRSWKQGWIFTIVREKTSLSGLIINNVSLRECLDYYSLGEDIPTLHYACSSWIKKTMAGTRDCLWEYGFVLEYGIIWKSVFTHYPVKLMCFFFPFL